MWVWPGKTNFGEERGLSVLGRVNRPEDLAGETEAG